LSSQSPIGYSFNYRDDIFTNNPDSGIEPLYWNNGILFLGFCFDEGQSKYGTTLKFYDLQGNMQWSHLYFHPTYQVYNGADILAYNNSSFYMGGYCRKTFNSEYRAVFAKFNSQGEIIFWNVFPDTANKAIACMEKFAEDTILLCSKWDTDLEDEQKIIIEKIDTLGNIHLTSVGSYALREPYQILKTPDNRIFVGGNRMTENDNIKLFNNVYDLSLNYLYTVDINETVNEWFGSFIVMNNKVYLTATVSVYGPPGNDEECRISKLSSYGYLTVTSKFLGLAFNLSVGNAITLNDNCMVVPIGYGFSNGIFFLLDSNLVVNCSTYVYLPNVLSNMRYFGTIAAVPGNRIAGSGYVFDDPNNLLDSQDHWNYLTLSVTDFIEENCLTSTSNENYTMNNESKFFNIYPNPFVDELTIEDLNKGEAEFNTKLYEITGNLIYKSVSVNNLIVNLGHLQRGIYFLELQNKNFHEVKKIVKN
jgi:hypothetical protein